MAEQLSFGAFYVASELTGNEKQLIEQVLSENMSFIPSSKFNAENAESVIFDPSHDVAIQWSMTGSGNVKCTVLTREQEGTLFLRYNYSKKRCIEYLEAFRSNPSKSNADSLAQWYSRVRSIREDIAKANLSLVLEIVKERGPKYVGADDLVSEGNAALLRTMDRFDVSKGWKFSTYLWRSVMKGFGRIARKERSYRNTFPAEYNPNLEDPYIDARSLERDTERVEMIRHIIRSDDTGLTTSEIRSLELRFINNRMSYDKMASILGVSREVAKRTCDTAIQKVSEQLKKQLSR